MYNLNINMIFFNEIVDRNKKYREKSRRINDIVKQIKSERVRI